MTDFIDNIYFDSSDSIDNNFEVELDKDKETDSESVIDTSWIQEYDKLNKLSNHQERTFMESIPSYYIYINKNLYIDKILYEKIPLDKNMDTKFSYISKEFLLKIIQNKKIKTPFSKYRLIDVLSFVVNIEPEIMQEFSNQNLEDGILDEFNTNIQSGFLKVLPILNDISIDKSIFVFHNINSLYFIFQETENHNNNSHRHTLRSILKKNSNKTFRNNSLENANDNSDNFNISVENTSNNIYKHHSTKKVRIVTDVREHSELLNKEKNKENNNINNIISHKKFRITRKHRL